MEGGISEGGVAKESTKECRMGILGREIENPREQHANKSGTILRHVCERRR